MQTEAIPVTESQPWKEKRVISLEDQISILKDALSFYAKFDVWKRRTAEQNEFGNKRWKKPNAIIDAGSMARFVLASLNSDEGSR